jgi:hypothetical protein
MIFDHPIAIVPHPARDCPLVIPLPHEAKAVGLRELAG